MKIKKHAVQSSIAHTMKKNALNTPPVETPSISISDVSAQDKKNLNKVLRWVDVGLFMAVSLMFLAIFESSR